MKHLLIYSGDTGRISGYVSGTGGNPSLNIPPGHEAIVGGDGDADTQYVDLSTITVVDKPQLAVTPDKLTATADGIDAVTITGLPTPCDVAFAGLVVDNFQVTDGVLSMTFSAAGTYTLTLSAFPYLLQELVIDAV
jgi:hypothetical protein